MTEIDPPQISQALVVSFRQELSQAAVKYRKIEELVAAGWTLPMVREAADIAKVQAVPFGYIARLTERGISLPVIAELIEVHKAHPDLAVPALHRAWELCMSERFTDDDRAFFAIFLDACEMLFEEATGRLKLGVSRTPAFVFGRLIEYVLGMASRDLEAVYREMIEDPESLLDLIMESSERGLDHGGQHRIRRGNPFEVPNDLYDDEENVNLPGLYDNENDT